MFKNIGFRLSVQDMPNGRTGALPGKKGDVCKKLAGVSFF